MASSAPVWRIIDLDSGEEIVGQYEAQGVGADAKATYSTSWGMGQDYPILQWTHGSEDEIKFVARLFATDSGKSIKAQIDTLKALTKRDPDLNRPHICRLVIGVEINERVVVTSVGDVKYDGLRNDGSARGALLPIACTPYHPFDIEVSDPNAPPSSTRYYRAAEGETFEHVARLLYYDASLGDLLRRRHPEFMELAANDLIVAPDAKEIRMERAEPYSVPLTRTVEFLQLRKTWFDRTGVPFESSVLR